MLTKWTYHWIELIRLLVVSSIKDNFIVGETNKIDYRIIKHSDFYVSKWTDDNVGSSHLDSRYCEKDEYNLATMGYTCLFWFTIIKDIVNIRFISSQEFIYS